MYDDYRLPDRLFSEKTSKTGYRVSWLEIWANRELVEADLHSEYGVDLSSGVLQKRTGRWLRVRVQSLLSADTRISRKLAASKKR